MYIKEQDFNVKLIETIKKYPCLYNYTLPEYSRRETTDRAWAEIAQEVDETATICKEKWKNIRTVFVRKLKPSVNGLSRKLKKPYYLNEMLHFLLPYVKPHTSDMVGQENISHQVVIKGENDFEVDSDNLDEEPVEDNFPETEWIAMGDSANSEDTSSKPVCEEFEPMSEKCQSIVNRGKKRKKEAADADKPSTQTCNFVCNKLDEENTRKMFLLSLLPELNDMNDQQVKVFKRRVLALIDDILVE